jgi:hypothetical protein
MRRLGLVELRSLAVRRNPVDDSLLAGAGVENAVGVGSQRPDVLLLGIEEGRRLAVAIELVDLAVRRGGDVEPAVRRQRERVRLELRRVEEGCALAVGVDAVDAPVVAGADEQRSVRRRQHRPQERRWRLVDLLGGRPEQQLPAAVDGEVLDLAFEEFGLVSGLKELGGGGAEHRRRAGEHRGDGQRAPRERRTIHEACQFADT